MSTVEPSLWDRLVASAPLDEQAVDEAVEAIMAELTDREKLQCLSGDEPLIPGAQKMAVAYNSSPLPAGVVPRLGIPGIQFADGPRGCVVGTSTVFPVAMARGATFDVALETEVASAIGKEIRAQGGNLFAGVCINLLRHPGWGRAQETYGEDTHLLGEMGAASVLGAQQHVMACIKHFALNSIENSRFKVDVTCDRADLDDVYLPHFKRCIDVGASAVMSSYNKVNGSHASESRELLTDILRDDWGFEGFVMSDFVFGVRNAARTIQNGGDLEMPFNLRSRLLPLALKRGQLSSSDVDRAVRRLVRTQLCHVGVGDDVSIDVVAGAAHRDLAKRVAETSMVLLKNDPPEAANRPLLPIDRARVTRLAVVGKLASMPNTGDKGSSDVRNPDVTTIAQGMRQRCAEESVSVIVSDSDDAEQAATAATGADVVLVVVGNTHRDEGEYVFAYGGDRVDLDLRDSHERLIEAMLEITPNVVVALVGGSAITCERWIDRVPAALMTWYSGMRGGDAVAAIVLGDADPGGRLPFTWPRSIAQLPEFDPSAKQVTYGPLVGYRRQTAHRTEPRWWFGHGGSYTSFEWGDPTVDLDANTASVEVRNTGARDGRDVVQMYIDVALGTDDRSLPALCGFAPVELAPGESDVVTIPLDQRLLQQAGPLARVRAGRSADPKTLLAE